MANVKHYGGWAVITGASAGIGEAFARQIAAEGVDCVLVARREDRLSALAKELEKEHGVKTRVAALDLALDDCADRLAGMLEDIKVGILVNNAGFGDAGAFHTREPEKIARMIKVNCLAPALLTRAFLPAMLKRKKGAIVTVSSVLGLVPCGYETVYGATKAFDLSFGEGLWGELRGTGVDSIVICPSLTATEFLYAEGLDKDWVDKTYRGATRPEHIAKITLRALGRQSAVGPRDFHLMSAARRMLPRGVVARLMAFGTRRMMRL